MTIRDTSYNQRNVEQTERLKSLRRLSDADLARPMGEHWTVAVALAHVQYWDSRGLGAVEVWKRHGVPLVFWQTPEGMAVNDLRLELWRAIPPRDALEHAIATAEALDRVVAALTPDEAEAVAAERQSVLQRWWHRGEHLTEIAEVLAR
jgi:hypothetical protein